QLAEQVARQRRGWRAVEIWTAVMPPRLSQRLVRPVSAESRLKTNDRSRVPKARRAGAGTNLLLRRHADGLPVLWHRAVLQHVVHDVEEPFAQLARLHVNARDLDLHVPEC